MPKDIEMKDQRMVLSKKLATIQGTGKRQGRHPYDNNREKWSMWTRTGF